MASSLKLTLDRSNQGEYLAFLVQAWALGALVGCSGSKPFVQNHAPWSIPPDHSTLGRSGKLGE